jgi:NADH-quinone oxidoreductase subunit L
VTIEALLPLLLILPMAGFLFTALVGRRLGKQAHWVPVGVIFIVWIIAMVAVFNVLTGSAPLIEGSEELHGYVAGPWTWIPAGSFQVHIGLFVDPLTACLLIVVTTIGLLVHIYSIGYMAHDPGYWRFFAYLNLFMFSMLLLVLADSWLVVFVAWELVGLSSYLLIGFWYRKRSAALAAKKAFIVNRVGDFGFALGIMAIFLNTGTLDIRQSLDTLLSPTLVAFPIPVPIVALLVFAGAMGKSAQFPLHVWLPDAMEGPTPVSALIHAATMVTAGVYMIVRTNVLYELAPYAADLVAIVGAATLLMAATIALVQEDIKRVLAWSTVSQIGYMIMAAGLGIYGASMFHFLTHAFFKALLFLAVGIAIHALVGEQSLDRMGGLRRYLPVTNVAVLVGCLAISGIPPFSGFFSKDEILSTAMEAGGLGVFCGVVGVIAAGLTAFYMFRLYFRAFWGPDPAGGYRETPHEGGWAMAAPVTVLAIGATFIGWLQIPGGWHLVNDWLEPTLIAAPDIEPTAAGEWIVSLVSVGLALAAIAIAAWVFVLDPTRRTRLLRAPAGRQLLQDQYRFDDVYEEAVIQPGRDLGDVFTTTVERYGVQGSIEGVVRSTIDFGRGLRVVESGLVRAYAFAMIGGVAVVGAVLALAFR